MSESPPTGSARPADTDSRSVLLHAALVLAIAALAAAAWSWNDQRGELASLRQDVARRLAESDTQNRASKLVADQVREAARDAQVKIGVLEARLAESQSQQIALEALYQELSRNRDEWAFSEIEQSLLIANQQLQLAGNVKGALIALGNADARLQRMERPQLVPLRKAIVRDMERLKALPYVDTVGISTRIDSAITAVDNMPLAMDTRPRPDAAAGAAPTDATVWWAKLWREAWTELRSLVRVQRVDQQDVPLLAPPQIYFLRENLKLRLIGARLALLARDQASYRADIKAARDWVAQYYDVRDKSVAAALATLRGLHDAEVSIELPDISSTLDALRNLRVARDRPGR